MASLKFMVCFMLVLLSSAMTETRPLNQSKEETSLNREFGASMEVKTGKESKNVAQREQPKRVSPGGPDPEHHSKQT